MNGQTERGSVIIRTSIIGILANVLLAAFKAVVGITANSIAIVMDAVNNLSDAASSVITIVGTKLAGKKADRLSAPLFEAKNPIWAYSVCSKQFTGEICSR